MDLGRPALSVRRASSLTPGLGYVVWYLALGGLTGTRVAIVQLAVPILAGAGDVSFLAETISQRLLLPAALVLGGITRAVVGRERLSHRSAR